MKKKNYQQLIKPNPLPCRGDTYCNYCSKKMVDQFGTCRHCYYDKKSFRLTPSSQSKEYCELYNNRYNSKIISLPVIRF